MQAPQQHSQGLADASREAFESQLVNFTGSLRHATSARRRELLADAIRAITENDLLPKREADRRLRLLLAIRSFDSNDILHVAQKFHDATSGLQNAFLSVLPPDKKRQLLLGSRPEVRASSEPEESQPEDLSNLEQFTPKPESSVFRAVALLGTAAEHSRNASLLEENDFTPLRREGAGALEDLISSDVCGLVVGGSFWEGKDARKQEDDLRRICNMSSLLFLKIDETNLAAPAGRVLIEFQSKYRGGPEFCRGKCDLTLTDIVVLNRLVALLEASEYVSITSDELNESEARLLRLTTTLLVSGRYIEQGSTVGRMGLRFIPGGRSGARVAVVTPDDGGVSLIAKIHEISRLQDELERYRKYIVRWESAIRPTLHFHLGASLIIYNLVDDQSAPGLPAPTLAERIEKLSMSELGSWGENLPREDDLSTMIERVVLRLETLNRVRTSDADHDKSGWLPSGAQHLLKSGVLWSIFDGNQELDLEGAFRIWMDRAKRLEGKALVHGDLHLRNVLAVEDKRPVFIDYSLSGPGHPCYDLARLSIAIACRFFRMLRSEEETAEFLRAVLIEGKNYEDIQREYRVLLSCASNRIAAKSLILSRAACIRILDVYRGEPSDFLAMQGLVASYALTSPDLQCGMARAILRAII